jgi:hypothetical protein
MRTKTLIFTAFLVSLPIIATAAPPNQYVHVYYYGWYPGNWNRADSKTGKVTPTSQITPSTQCATIMSGTHSHNTQTANDISASYYPVEGRYSVSNTTTLAHHRSDINQTGAKAVILSYGQGGNPTLGSITTIANNLSQSSPLRMAFAIRNYSNRDFASVQDDIKALRGATRRKQYKIKKKTWVDRRDVFRPVFYLFAPNDAPLDGGCGESVPWGDWGCIFKPGNRGWDRPFVVLGHNATATRLTDNGFDGFYGYSPAVRQTAQFYIDQVADAQAANALYSAGISPGYNTKRTKDDFCLPRNPEAYAAELTEAANAGPDFISVISFNEWNEGTQIEPAQTQGNAFSNVKVGCSGGNLDCNYEYIGYQGGGSYSTGSDIYLNVTRDFIGDSTLWSPEVPAVVK